jgi:uncharacterized protein YycO
MKKSIIIMIAALALSLSCCTKDDTAIRTGDLLFVEIPADYYPGMYSEGVTPESEDKLNIHVAMLEVQGDRTWIIDATIKHGVDRYPLDTFLTEFTLEDGSYPVFEIKRPDVSAGQAGKFIENAKKFIGQAYDVDFKPDNGMMYCSELVYNAYVTDSGKHLFEESTISFLDSEGKVPRYWKVIFDWLGKDIPEGNEGIMPEQMAADKDLSLVRIGF